MATAALCGYSGSVVGATGALECFYWEIDQTVDAVEATSFDSAGWKERIACLKGATGSFKSQGHPSTLGAKTVTFKDNVAGYTIAGSILINKIDTSTPVDSKVEFNHTFNFTGSFTAS